MSNSCWRRRVVAIFDSSVFRWPVVRIILIRDCVWSRECTFCWESLLLFSRFSIPSTIAPTKSYLTDEPWDTRICGTHTTHMRKWHPWSTDSTPFSKSTNFRTTLKFQMDLWQFLVQKPGGFKNFAVCEATFHSNDGILILDAHLFI